MAQVSEGTVRHGLEKAFCEAWQVCRIIFFSAPCGCGKTTTVKALLERKKIDFKYLSAADFKLPENFRKNKLLLIDDFQLLDDEGRDKLMDVIQNETGMQFVLLSRGVIPGWLMPFRMTGTLKLFETQDLLFDRTATADFMKQAGLEADEDEIARIYRDMHGYPIAMSILRQYMAHGGRYADSMLSEVKGDLFRYFDEMVFNRFEEPLRSLLISMAIFESVDVEFAKILSGDNRAGEYFDFAVRSTTMFRITAVNEYVFYDIFREYLMWKLKYQLSEVEIREIYSRAGLYYELHDNFSRALEFYSKAGEIHRVSSLLIRNSNEHPGAAHYLELEKYYNMLPREEIIKSPALLCAMSMLSAMCMKYDESEIWYKMLQDYAVGLKKTDAEYREASFRLAYLNVALPQRGTRGMTDIMSGIFKMVAQGDIAVPGWSATSSLPSTMNGAKDFCSWSKHDDLLYATMRLPVETVLGKNGVGLADQGICESKFEKGLEIAKPMLTLMSRLGDIQAHGTADMEFAVIGLLARVQMADGKAEDAFFTIKNIRKKFEREGEVRFLANIDAMIARIQLLMGNANEAEKWFREAAPHDDTRVWVLWRYQYITKATVHLAIGENELALMDVARLIPYCENCERTMDTIYIYLLMAIAHYRMRIEDWKREMAMALDLCFEYHFIYPVAQYGTAILPLMNEIYWDRNEKYLKQLMAAVRKQAVNYPRFLKQEKEQLEPLSDTELQVLKLICEDMSNNDICEILGIKIPTVKTHVSHILQKLQVERRSEARARAQKLHLF